MEGYFERFGGVRDYLRTIVAQARLDGYTETVLGRRRYLPDLTSDNRQRREMAERMALNAPDPGLGRRHHQGRDAARRRRAARRPGCARGCCCRCTTSWSSRWHRASGSGRRRWCATQMGGAYPLDVPLEVSVGAGRDWAAADH